MFKAEIVNGIVSEFDVRHVVEFGCGDGHQLSLAQYPSYQGYDISPASVERCRTLFAGDTTKRFDLVTDYDPLVRFDLAISLDVIFHLTDDTMYAAYMHRLFEPSDRLVLIYSSNEERPARSKAPHVRHRKFTDWTSDHVQNWTLIRKIPNKYPWKGRGKSESLADFYLYAKNN